MKDFDTPEVEWDDSVKELWITPAKLPEPTVDGRYIVKVNFKVPESFEPRPFFVLSEGNP